MAREITITQESMNALKKAFMEALAKTKIADGKIKFEHELGTVDRKATIRFTEKAWEKMQKLIHGFDSEIGWDGIVKRGEGDTYIVSDILVCPQTVTGATVHTEPAEYAQWIGSFVDDDEVFPYLRFQGHSHVNMGVTPSSTDTQGWDVLLSQLGDHDFYLFMIFNKRGEKTIRLYDFDKNVRFDTADCVVEIEDGEYGLSSFLNDAKDKVRPTTTAAANAASCASGYSGGYYSSGYAGYSGSSGTQTKLNPGPNDIAPPKNDAAKPAQKQEKPASKTGWRRKDSWYDAYDYDGYGC